MASSIEIDVSANIAKFKTAMDKAAHEGSQLNKKLDRAFKGVGTAMKAVGALAGVAVAGGLGTLAKQAINAADEVEKLSRRTGGSVEFLSEMRFALSQNDVSMQEFETSLRKINKSTADASAGLSTQTRAFAALGIKVEDFQKLDTDKKFVVLSEAISKVKDPAIRTQTAMDIMGRSGEALITVMEGGAAGLAEYRKESERLGLSLTKDQAEKAAAANDAIDKLTSSISGAFTQSVLDNIGWIEKMGDTFDNLQLIGISLVEGLLVGFERLKGGTKIVGEGIKLAFLGAFDIVFEAQSALFTKIGEGLNLIKSGLGDGLISLGKSASEVLTPLDDYNERLTDIRAETEAAISAVREHTGDMADQAISSKLAGKAIGATSDETKDFAFELAQSTKELNDSKKALEENAKAAEELRKKQEQLTAEYRESVSIYGKYADANDEVYSVLLDVTKAEERRKGIIREVSNLVADGAFTQDQANEILKQTGVLTDEVADKQKDLGSTVTTVRGLWERANDSMFNSLQTFFSSGLKDTASFADSFKDTFTDMISSVLAEITRLIASNAFKKFLGLMGVGGSANQGVGIFDGLGAMFGGGGDSGGNSGIGGVGSAVSGITQLFSGMGGGASGTSGIAGIGRLLFGGGNTSAAGAVMPTSGIFGGAGLGSLGSSLSTIAAAIPYIALAAAVIESGGPILYRGVKELFSSGARSPQQLGLDQLQSVSDATKAGRNTQVQLGSVAGVGTSFLGGFDENSTFFGVDLVKEELQKVGDILTSKFGFNQALALKDGVIRLEDFSRDFSENNERIVAEVQASILIAKKGFEDAELAKVAALGRSVIAMDRLYDQSASSGLSSADRLKEAYMGAFGASESAAMEALNNMGIGTEKLADIFDSSSNEILATLTGVSTEGLGLFGEGLAQIGDQANETFNQIRGGFGGVADFAAAAAARAASSFNNSLSSAQSSADSQARRNEDTNARLMATMEENTRSNTALAKTQDELTRQLRNGTR